MVRVGTYFAYRDTLIATFYKSWVKGTIFHFVIKSLLFKIIEVAYKNTVQYDCKHRIRNV